jgi:PTS system galactitol-specific IIA component
MGLSIFSHDLIFIKPDITDHNQTDVIHFLCDRLMEKEYVTEEYFSQVIHREKNHPTGLPTLPFASAVPHADPIGVKNTGIALAILNEPVIFNAMDEPKKKLDVSLVFLMAFLRGDQIALLRWISNVLSNQTIVKEIGESVSPVHAFQTILPFLNKNLEGEENNVPNRKGNSFSSDH